MVLDTTKDPAKSANLLLTRAQDAEAKKSYTKALVLYQEGLQIYMDYLKIAPESQRRTIRDKMEHFMTKAEATNQLVQQQKKLSTYHEAVEIEDGETGHSYESVFGHLLDSDVKIVHVEDAYIREFHQFANFTRFCELVIKKCPNLSRITLTTVLNNDKQSEYLQKLKESIAERKILFGYKDNPNLHDRLITLSNGWMIKSGRGLDYFKKPAHNLALGAFDMDLRPCHQGTINIFYQKDLIKN